MEYRLDSPLNKYLNNIDLRLAIVTSLWPVSSPLGLRQAGEDFEAFFNYYAKQCNYALHDRGRHVLLRVHQDVIDIAQQLQAGVLKADIKLRLRGKLTTPKLQNEDEVLDASVDLAARLLLMVDVGDPPHAFTGRQHLEWTEGPLKSFVHSLFSEQPCLKHDDLKISKDFDAHNLELVAGLRIVWTDNLADHLRLMDDDCSVAIFHHATFLDRQQRSSMFPDGLIEETIRTLALLFPQWDIKTRKWFGKLPYGLQLDGAVLKCGRCRAQDRRFERFHYWRDRLVILQQAFDDDSSPKTVMQWIRDRRNLVQWYSFWTAVLLTIFFGLVQSIEGALQVYKAYHPTGSG